MIADWADDREYEVEDNAPVFGDRAEVDEYRAQLAKVVADRLLAWLRWPGALMFCFSPPRGWSRCTPAEARELRARGLEVFVTHPLDAEVRGKALMLCLTSNGAEVCYCGELWDNHDGLRGCHTAREVTCLACDGHPWRPQWPVVAVICDALSERGMWGDVHAWRPS